MQSGGIEAGIKMFREEFAIWRQDHVVVSCGHFKNRQPAAGERCPTCSLPLGIARTAEHRDVAGIGLGTWVRLPEDEANRSKRAGTCKGWNAPSKPQI